MIYFQMKCFAFLLLNCNCWRTISENRGSAIAAAAGRLAGSCGFYLTRRQWQTGERLG